MFADPLVLTLDQASAATKNYVLIQNGGAGSLRVLDAVDDGVYPHFLKISHQVVGKGEAVRDRHLVRLETSSVDGTSIGTKLPLVAYAVIDAPRAYINSSAMAAMNKSLTGLIRGATGTATPSWSAFWDKLVRGEM